MNPILFNFSLGLYNMILILMINKLNEKNITTEEQLDELNKDIDKIESITGVNIKSDFYKLLDYMSKNQTLSYFIIYLILSIPIINIFIFISLVLSLIGNNKWC